MEIRLLGTGSAEGWPGMFCDCPVCRQSRVMGGKNLRSRSSALIDGGLKIDLPPDTQHHVLTQNLDMSGIKHLLFTHGHDDHCAGYELQYLSWMFVPQPVTTPLNILAPRTTLDKLCRQLEGEAVPVSMKAIEPWSTVPFGRWQVTALVANHDPEQTCFNYLISDGSSTLLYATDTGWYSEPTWEFLKDKRIDAAVIEASKGLSEGGYSGHMNAAEVIRMREWLMENGVMSTEAPVVTTHHSHLGGVLHEGLEAILNPHAIQVGYDGMVVEI